MKRQRIIVAVSVLLLVTALLWLFRGPLPTESDATSATAQTQGAQAPSPPIAEAERFKEASALVDSVFSAPIEFYGRVIDQNGNPVPYANVGYTAADKFNASGSNYTGQADAEGYFQIKGIQGAGLAVTVRKEGYYLIHNPSDPTLPTSTATFAYGMGPDSYRRPAPKKNSPAVFVLQKMGEKVPLIFVQQSTRIPKDGTPVTVDLLNGSVSSKGNFRIETWTDAPRQGRKFSWRSRLTVLGGGLRERQGQFDFEAPEDGYLESIELTMPEDAEQWESQQERKYFVKLPDGRYARTKFRMIAGGNHYFIFESFLNPTPGDRNLEFDPAKVVESP